MIFGDELVLADGQAVRFIKELRNVYVVEVSPADLRLVKKHDMTLVYYSDSYKSGRRAKRW